MENKKPEKNIFYWEYKYDKEKFSKDIKKYIIDMNKNSHIIDLHGIPIENTAEVLQLEEIEKILENKHALIVTYPKNNQEEYKKNIIEILDKAEDIHPDWNIKVQQYSSANQIVIFKTNTIHNIKYDNIEIPINVNIKVGENSTGMSNIEDYLRNLEIHELSQIQNKNFIKNIEIKRLFGLFNYKINFNNGNVCVVHAPNGCGKTTAFKLIDNCLSNNSNTNIYCANMLIETNQGSINISPSMFEHPEENIDHLNLTIRDIQFKKYDQIFEEYLDRTKDVHTDESYRFDLFNDIMSEFFKFEKTVELYFDKYDKCLAWPLKITYIETENLTEPIPGLFRYGQDLPFEVLSTGEQNIINIFINLIFKTKYNSFVMIDEPEISLHMEWQLLLLRNIIRVANELDLQILVATHSPYLLESNDIEIASVGYGE